eukprot:3931900-Rhodomonas_salina.1
MIAGYEELADIDMLEPDPPNCQAAMKNVCLRPFWMQSENKEMDGLNAKGCFKKWKHSDLEPNNRVFGSLFHYHIKRDATTGHITNCKVCLVVMGHRMTEGEDYIDAFAPVPHSTSARVIISLAAALDLELHSCDLTQAFIQADRLEGGVNGRIFITPPKGWGEQEDVVYECQRL